TIDAPGANETQARGISDSGQIVGFYSFPPADSAGHEATNTFVLSGGSFSTFSYPGAYSTYWRVPSSRLLSAGRSLALVVFEPRLHELVEFLHLFVSVGFWRAVFQPAEHV